MIVAVDWGEATGLETPYVKGYPAARFYGILRDCCEYAMKNRNSSQVQLIFRVNAKHWTLNHKTLTNDKLLWRCFRFICN